MRSNLSLFYTVIVNCYIPLFRTTLIGYVPFNEIVVIVAQTVNRSFFCLSRRSVVSEINRRLVTVPIMFGQVGIINIINRQGCRQRNFALTIRCHLNRIRHYEVIVVNNKLERLFCCTTVSLVLNIPIEGSRCARSHTDKLNRLISSSICYYLMNGVVNVVTESTCCGRRPNTLHFTFQSVRSVQCYRTVASSTHCGCPRSYQIVENGNFSRRFASSCNNIAISILNMVVKSPNKSYALVRNIDNLSVRIVCIIVYKLNR